MLHSHPPLARAVILENPAVAAAVHVAEDGGIVCRQGGQGAGAVAGGEQPGRLRST